MRNSVLIKLRGGGLLSRPLFCEIKELSVLDVRIILKALKDVFFCDKEINEYISKNPDNFYHLCSSCISFSSDIKLQALAKNEKEIILNEFLKINGLDDKKPESTTSLRYCNKILNDIDSNIFALSTYGISDILNLDWSLFLTLLESVSVSKIKK